MFYYIKAIYYNIKCYLTHRSSHTETNVLGKREDESPILAQGWYESNEKTLYCVKCRKRVWSIY